VTTLSTLLDRATDLMFGCLHTNYSFPITRGKYPHKRTTVCCLNCGQEFEYDLDQMKRTNKLSSPKNFFNYVEGA
jgi:hypothetical protein